MIIRLVVVLVVLYLMYRLFRMLLLPDGGRQNGDRENKRLANREDLVEDPYCHTYVPEGDAYRASIDGETVYFCSQKCYKQYRAMRKEQAKEGKNP